MSRLTAAAGVLASALASGKNDALFMAGLGSVFYGLHLFSPALAYVVIGVLVMGLSISLERHGTR